MVSLRFVRTVPFLLLSVVAAPLGGCQGELTESDLDELSRRIAGSDATLRLATAEECAEYEALCAAARDVCSGDLSRKQRNECDRIDRQCTRVLARDCADVTMGDAGLPSSDGGDTPPGEDGGASGRDGGATEPEPDGGTDAGSADAGTDAGHVVPADSFACLRTHVPAVNVAQDLITGDTTLSDGTPVPDTELWFSDDGYNQVPTHSSLDARGATIVTPTFGWSREYRKWYPFSVRGDLQEMCIAGGSFLGLLPLDIGWHDSKGSAPDAIGDNSAPVAFNAPRTTVTGVYITNNHDSVRPGHKDGQQAHDWTVAHTWIEYNRDDCIESDAMQGSGQLTDSLLEGCYVAISTRDSSPQDRTQDLYTFDRVLIRMEPMPFPYKWWERNQDSHIYVEPYTEPTENAGYLSEEGIPFNHGPVFKLNGDPDHNPRFALTNNVFLFQVNDMRQYRFPPNHTITECHNNTIVWAGEGSLADFEAAFDVPATCEGEIHFTDDLGVWQAAVADWHARHPNVGAEHKPAVMGDIRIPRWDRRPWPY